MCNALKALQRRVRLVEAARGNYWVAPSGKLIFTQWHTQTAEEMTGLEGTEATKELYRQGYVRVVFTRECIYWNGGVSSRAVRRALQDLSFEWRLPLVDDRGQVADWGYQSL